MANNTSSTGAGYALVGVPGVVSTTTRFTVPKLICTPTLSAGYASAIVNTSTSASAAGVELECSGGTAIYVGALLTNGNLTDTTFTPKAGDVIVASAAESTTAAKVTLRDVTQKKSQSAAGTGSTPVEVSDVVDALAAGSQLPMVNFGKIAYSATEQDGKTPAKAGAKAYNQVSSSGVLQIATGNLNAQGNAWTETFKHA